MTRYFSITCKKELEMCIPEDWCCLLDGEVWKKDCGGRSAWGPPDDEEAVKCVFIATLIRDYPALPPPLDTLRPEAASFDRFWHLTPSELRDFDAEFTAARESLGDARLAEHSGRYLRALVGAKVKRQDET